MIKSSARMSIWNYCQEFLLLNSFWLLVHIWDWWSMWIIYISIWFGHKLCLISGTDIAVQFDPRLVLCVQRSAQSCIDYFSDYHSNCFIYCTITRFSQRAIERQHRIWFFRGADAQSSHFISMTLLQVDDERALPVHLELTESALVVVPRMFDFQVLFQVALLLAAVVAEVTTEPCVLQHQFLGRVWMTIIDVLPQVLVGCKVHGAT